MFQSSSTSTIYNVMLVHWNLKMQAIQNFCTLFFPEWCCRRTIEFSELRSDCPYAWWNLPNTYISSTMAESYSKYIMVHHLFWKHLSQTWVLNELKQFILMFYVIGQSWSHLISAYLSQVGPYTYLIFKLSHHDHQIASILCPKWPNDLEYSGIRSESSFYGPNAHWKEKLWTFSLYLWPFMGGMCPF